MDDPACATVTLPSSLAGLARTRLGLDSLACAEVEIRIGHAFDCLESLRRALGVRSFLTRHAKKARGYEKSTREQAAIKKSEGTVKTYTHAYRKTWSALSNLNVPAHRLGNLRALAEADLIMLSTWLEEEQYRSRNAVLPWIWEVASMPSGLDDGEREMAERVSEWQDEGEHLFRPGLQHLS